MAQFRKFAPKTTYSGTTAPKVPAAKNNTDVIAPDVKLYIEGVQVPFEAISIAQAYGRRPSADIQIPPSSGLMDILRGYSPKVHIFYKDDNYGGDRLLFWGVVTSTRYHRSRRGQGSSSINFHCEHKNMLADQLTLDFTGWASPVNPSFVDPNLSNSVYKPKALNSKFMIVHALNGITGVATGEEIISSSSTSEKLLAAPTNKIDPSLSIFSKRLTGLPSASVNLWNQLRKDVYADKTHNVALATMYIPLIEDSLGMFSRMSGHPLLENKVQDAKGPYCKEQDLKDVSVMTPPIFSLSITSAIQRQLGVETIANQIGFSGELTSFPQMLEAFYGSINYEILTLASPAEINVDPDVFTDDFSKSGVVKSTIETVIKPQLPFYYAPICNVLLPRMYESIQIDQEEAGVPSRVTASHDGLHGQGGSQAYSVNYRGPHTIREAVAYNALLAKNETPDNLSLASVKSYSYAIPGKYEQGKGIRPEATGFPWWLATLTSNSSASGDKSENYPLRGTDAYNDMMALNIEWQQRNGTDINQADSVMTTKPNLNKAKLNPYDPRNGDILPHERLLFSTVDYEFSKRIAGSRAGTIEAAFNPYIIPGYPMDVIDDSPNHPSFHGMCISVNHTITSRSIGTTIGMAAAMTYAELSNYYTPPSPPFLQTALNLVNSEIDEEVYNLVADYSTTPFSNVSSTLLQNPAAKASADTFYKQVLGVGAAAPDELIHFSSGRAYPVTRNAGVFIPTTNPAGSTIPDLTGHAHSEVRGRHTIDYYSTVGSLRLVSRPIESKDSISSKFEYNFIDMGPTQYNNTFMNYVNPILAAGFYLEPGASLFLDYMETEDFIKASKVLN